jgi:large subunit ribosomal protein L18
MEDRQKVIRKKRERRHKRQRVNAGGTKNRPRLSVFRSNKHIFCQVIDDGKGQTLVAASDLEIKDKKTKKKKAETSFMVGELIAKKALKKDIKKVVFDKSWFKYHGRVKAVADGARKAGLKF